MGVLTRGGVSRRRLIQGALAAGSVAVLERSGLAGEVAVGGGRSLAEFGYEQVEVRGERQVSQRENVSGVLMGLDEDSLLKPFREMAGQPGPGANLGTSLGGWYAWNPTYDFHHDDTGFAPASQFGQWMSAIARMQASSRFGGGAGRPEMRERVVRLNGLMAETISPEYFAKTRFAAYTLDKLVCGAMDAHRLLGDTAAFEQLDRVTAAAAPSLPGHALEREVQWRPGADISWMWDENYTMPENLYLISTMGAGGRYRQMAEAYMADEQIFEPLSRGVNVLSDKHAYSYVNALCSAMQAYFTGGSAMHFAAAKNGFQMVEQQSFATGGWGPDELLRKPGYDQIAKSLVVSHNSFETPCGSYAHMKLTRYLLRATRDGRYGDSMERVLHNTVLGSMPLQADGRSFYYADYNVVAKRVYSLHRWPCCSGTLPQVVADYGINGYLRERGAVWVNLYQPSEVRWTEGASALRMEQTTEYPENGKIRLRMTASRPVRFALRLRVPGWAGAGATLRVNGRLAEVAAVKGFTTVERVWRTGDVVELELPMSLRLEPLPADGGQAHPQTVALLWGPLVLFALRETGETGPLGLRSEALLGAERTGPREWRVTSSTADRRMVPFTEVGERMYSTYVTLV